MTQSNTSPTPPQWNDLGYKLVAFAVGTKGPSHSGWHRKAANPERIGSGNFGVLHGLSGTCSIDLDDFDAAIRILEALGVDYDEELSKTFAWRGRPERAKLLYRLPEGVSLPIRKLADPDNAQHVLIELRGPGDGSKAAQDLLPPSIHPKTQKPYECITRPRPVAELPEPPQSLLDVWLNWDAWKNDLLRIAGYEPTEQRRLPKSVDNGKSRKAVEDFNASNDVGDLLERNGFERRGDKRWLRPNSTTGNPGVHLLEAGIVYEHGGSALGDTYPHDAFDVFRILEHNGSWAAAFRAVESTTDFIPPAPEDEQTTSRFITVRDLLSDLSPPKCLIDGFKELNTMGVEFGEWGSGKSFLAINEALRVAAGLPVHGQQVTRGAVVYILGEGHGGIGRRVAAWGFHNGLDPADLPIHFSRCAIPLLDAKQAAITRDEILRAADKLGEAPVAIYVDTLARNFGAGDESSNPDMQRFVANIDTYLRDPFKATVTITHHSGHSDKRRARGASSLPAANDFEFLISKDLDLVTYKCVKEKDLPEPEPVTYRLEPVKFRHGELDIESAIVDQFSRPIRPSPDKLTATQFKIFQLLKTLVDDERTDVWGGDRQHTNPKILVSAWKKAANDAGLFGHRNTFSKARDAILEAGLICIENGHAVIQEQA